MTGTSCTGSIDRVEYTYDGDGHRTQIKTTTSAGTLTTTDLIYQGDAIVQEKTNGRISREYIADEQGRIIKFCDPKLHQPDGESFSCVTRHSSGEEHQTLYSYDARHRLAGITLARRRPTWSPETGAARFGKVGVQLRTTAGRRIHVRGGKTIWVYVRIGRSSHAAHV